MIDSKNFFLVILAVLLLLFIGCIQSQKLSDKELEEKAKEYFYSLEDRIIMGFHLKTSDFVLEKSQSTNTVDYKLSDYECGYCYKFKERCSMTVDECKTFYGPIHVYDFKVKEGILPPSRLAYGKVVLKDNGEPIFYYWTGFEGFPE